MEDPGIAVMLDRRRVNDARTVTSAWMREMALAVGEEMEEEAIDALRRLALVCELVGEPGAPLRDHHGALTTPQVTALRSIGNAVSVRWAHYADDARLELDLAIHPEVAGYAAERAGYLQGIADAADRLLAALPPASR